VRQTIASGDESSNACSKQGVLAGGLLSVCNGSILLKKSAIVSMTEKYASEIEILNLRRGVRTQISRSRVLKMRFHRSIFRQVEKTDFFNRIGHKRTMMNRLLAKLSIAPSPTKPPSQSFLI
jgi:hypothetical protein